MTLAELAAKLGALAELIDEVNSALNNAGPGVLVPLNSTWSAESAGDAAELMGSQATLAERIDADLATQPGQTAADARALLAGMVADIKGDNSNE